MDLKSYKLSKNYTDSEVNRIVNRETDTDAMSRQAAVDADGVDHVNLKARLDAEQEKVAVQLAEKASQVEVDAALAEKVTKKDIGLRIIPYRSNGIIKNKLKTFILPFEVSEKVEVNRAIIKVEKNNAGALFEIGVLDSNFKLISRSGVRETFLGINEVSLDNRTLNIGRYYFALSCNNINVEFTTASTPLALSANYTLPLGISISNVFEEDKGVYFELFSNDLPSPTGFEFSKMDGIRAFAKGVSATVYGWNTKTGKVCKSVSQGATWVDLMPINPGGCWAMEVDEVNNILYAMTGEGRIYKTNDLTATATFTEITSPLRRSHASSLPESMKIWNGFLWYGEYSTIARGELDGGPRLLRYNLSTGEWKQSKQFPNARHIHSFTEVGTSALYVNLGDKNWGSDVGLHRIIPSAINDTTGDTWTQWTTPISPNSPLYNITSVVAELNGMNILLGSADQPGSLLSATKMTDTVVGTSNLSPQLRSFIDSDTTETVHNIVLDLRNNCYFITGETTKPRLCVSPPPYTQSYILKELSTGAIDTKPILSGEYIMYYDNRFKTVDFNNTVVTKKSRKYIYDQKEIEALTYGTYGAQTSRGAKNTDNLYVEAYSNINATVQMTGYYTTNKIDTTGYKRLVAEVEGFDSFGDSKIRIKLSNDTLLNGNVSERIVVSPSQYAPFTNEIELDLTSYQGLYHVHVMGLATGLAAQTKLKVKRIYLTMSV